MTDALKNLTQMRVGSHWRFIERRGCVHCVKVRNLGYARISNKAGCLSAAQMTNLKAFYAGRALRREMVRLAEEMLRNKKLGLRLEFIDGLV